MNIISPKTSATRLSKISIGSDVKVSEGGTTK
jgi:hypothetical protein